MTAQSPPWPPPISDMTCRFASNTGQFTSTLTGVTQGKLRNGARWEFDVKFHLVDTARMNDWLGFMANVQDQNLTFYWSFYPLGMPVNFPVDVTPFGNPYVHGAGQTGRSLAMQGGAGQIPLKRGDKIAFDNDKYREMHVLTADFTPDALGSGTLQIAPAIRRSPADGAPIYLDGHTTNAAVRCACEVIFASPAEAQQVLQGYQWNSSVKLIEALRTT